MKPSGNLPRTVRAFVKKDWREFRKPIAVITPGLLIPVLSIDASPDLAKGMIAGALMAAPFIYAQSCFQSERQHGTLDMLLALPLTPAELVLAKFISLFSMTLFTVNVPGIFLGDAALLFYANTAALFFATVFMAATVMSDKPWAGQIPLWVLMGLSLPAQRWVDFTMLAAHPLALAVAALGLIPVLIAISAQRFSRRYR